MFWKNAITAVAGLTSLAYALPQTSSRDLSISKRDNPCSSGPWASVLTIGSSNGGDGKPVTAQCESRFGGDYAPITAIDVWQDSNTARIAGLRFHYATGDPSKIFGHEDTTGQYGSIALAAGETFTSALLSGDGNGNYLGKVHLETSGGKKLDIGTSTAKQYTIQTGGGILYGAWVTEDDLDDPDIVALGLLFLGQSVKSIEVGNIQYQGQTAGSSQGIQPNSEFSGQWYNELDTNATFVYSQVYGVSQSYTFDQSSTNSFGIGVGVSMSGGLFGVASLGASVGATWSYATTSAAEQASSTATSVTCQATGTVMPNSGVSVQGTFQTGNASFPYTSTVTLHLEDGSTIAYQEGGTLNNIAYTSCNIDTKPDNSDNHNNTNSLMPVAGSPAQTTSAGSSSATGSSAGGSGSSGSSTASATSGSSAGSGSSGTSQPSNTSSGLVSVSANGSGSASATAPPTTSAPSTASSGAPSIVVPNPSQIASIFKLKT